MSEFELTQATARLTVAIIRYAKLFRNKKTPTRQEIHAEKTNVGAAIDQILDYYQKQGAPMPWLNTTHIWNDNIECLFTNKQTQEDYKARMTEFHNYYYETLQSDNE